MVSLPFFLSFPTKTFYRLARLRSALPLADPLLQKIFLSSPHKSFYTNVKQKKMTAYNKLPQDKIKDINKAIGSVTSKYSGTYFQRLWDTRQTHAVYGVTESTMDMLKDELKKIGATKFRKVKANGHICWILCFNAEKI